MDSGGDQTPRVFNKKDAKLGRDRNTGVIKRDTVKQEM